MSSNTSVYKLRCPDCHHGVRVRNSTQEHALLRVAYLQCSNVGCGATFRVEMETTHRMSPSANPNPAINLPMADSALRRAAIEQENSKQIDILDWLNKNDEPHAISAADTDTANPTP